MGLFDKKFCDVCGGKIGLLGNRKLEDGNLCKDCARKLSPFFSERRKSTVEDIKQQLAYREENKRQLASFHPTKTYGTSQKVHVDINQRKFIVSSDNNWRDENPDIIDFSQVTAVHPNIEENKTELYYEDNEGNSRSYNPPRYECEYEFHIEIAVNSPWFSEINLELTGYNNHPDSIYSPQYREMEMMMNDLVAVLTGNQPASSYAPQGAYGQPQNIGYVQQGAYGQPQNMGYVQQGVTVSLRHSRWELCGCARIAEYRTQANSVKAVVPLSLWFRQHGMCVATNVVGCLLQAHRHLSSVPSAEILLTSEICDDIPL